MLTQRKMAASRRSEGDESVEFRRLFVNRKALRLVAGKTTFDHRKTKGSLIKDLDSEIFSPRCFRRERYSKDHRGTDRQRLLIEPVNRIETNILSDKHSPIIATRQTHSGNQKGTGRRGPPRWATAHVSRSATNIDVRFTFSSDRRSKDGAQARETGNNPDIPEVHRGTKSRVRKSHHEDGFPILRQSSRPRTASMMCPRDSCAVESFSQGMRGSDPRCHCQRPSVTIDDYGLVGTATCSRHGRHTCALKVNFYTAAAVYYPFHRYRYWGRVLKPLKSPETRSIAISTDEESSCPRSPETRSIAVGRDLHDTLGLIQLRSLLAPAKRQEWVLFRNPDDGWYYEGTVTLDCGNYMYMVSDGNSHQVAVWREDIICHCDWDKSELKSGVKVILRHPNYRHSYVSGEVREGNQSLIVEMFSQKTMPVTITHVVAKVTSCKYKEDIKQIKTIADEWVGETVVARSKCGHYHIGKVMDHNGSDYTKFRVKWTFSLQNDDGIAGKEFDNESIVDSGVDTSASYASSEEGDNIRKDKKRDVITTDEIEVNGSHQTKEPTSDATKETADDEDGSTDDFDQTTGPKSESDAMIDSRGDDEKEDDAANDFDQTTGPTSDVKKENMRDYEEVVGLENVSDQTTDPTNDSKKETTDDNEEDSDQSIGPSSDAEKENTGNCFCTGLFNLGFRKNAIRQRDNGNNVGVGEVSGKNTGPSSDGKKQNTGDVDDDEDLVHDIDQFTGPTSDAKNKNTSDVEDDLAGVSDQTKGPSGTSDVRNVNTHGALEDANLPGQTTGPTNDANKEKTVDDGKEEDLGHGTDDLYDNSSRRRGEGAETETTRKGNEDSRSNEADDGKKQEEEELVDAVHVFGSITPMIEIEYGDYVLAPTAALCYLPGTVTQANVDDPRICVCFDPIKHHRVKIEKERCFWISESYYHNALTNYINAVV